MKDSFVEAALWCLPGETEQARRGIEHQIVECAAAANVVIGKIVWETVMPGDRRLPDLPERFPREAVCLIGRAPVIGPDKPIVKSSFLAELEPKDLERLRAVTRRAGAKEGRMLSDAECDELVEEIGPESAYRLLRGMRMN